MKTITLLFFTTLFSFVNIYAHKSAQREQKNALDIRISCTMNDSTKKPIGLTASIGMSWKYPKEAEDLIEQIDILIEKLNRKKVHYQATLNDKDNHLSEKQTGKITYQIKDIDSRIAELRMSKTDIVRVGNDKEHIYSFIAKCSEFGEHNVVKGEGKDVFIQGSCDAHFVHEIRHISLSFQYKNGLCFNKNNLLKSVFADGTVDELHGYRAQYAFEPNSLPNFYSNSMEHVNLEYLSKIQKTDGSFAYPRFRKMVEDDKIVANNNKKIDKDSISLPNIAANAKQ